MLNNIEQSSRPQIIVLLYNLRKRNVILTLIHASQVSLIKIQIYKNAERYNYLSCKRIHHRIGKKNSLRKKFQISSNAFFGEKEEMMEHFLLQMPNMLLCKHLYLYLECLNVNRNSLSSFNLHCA